MPANISRILNALMVFMIFGWTSLVFPGALTAQQSAQSDTMTTMSSGAPRPTMALLSELPHPFFTHMGMPEGVGVYSLRIGGLASRGVDASMGARRSDFFFHFETGLTERIGVHIRNDQFRSMPRTEVMFQFLALQTRDGTAGFAPIIEFEVPTRSEGGTRINTLTGFTATLMGPRAAFNTALHFNPREDMIDYSAGWVLAAGRSLFPVIEVLGNAGRGMAPGMRLLGGLKLPLTKHILVGLAVQIPLTTRRDFGSQLVFGPDFDWRTRRTTGAGTP